MCVLAIWLGLDPRTPLVVGANRDEAYARASAPPAEIEPGIFAGRDLQQGGTWLGYTRAGLFVAVTNRYAPPRAAASYSRGLLAVEALRAGTLEGVAAVVSRRVAAHHFAGFNLVVIAGGEGMSLHFDGKLRPVRFGAGAYVTSSDYDLGDPRMPEKRAFDAFVASVPGVPDEASLATFLASHEGERPVCKHGADFGTVSSIMLFASAAGARMFYAGGAPCRAPFAVVDGLGEPA